MPRPLLVLAAGLVLAGPALAQAPDTLHARLDLRGPIAAGWLDPATETVGLRGDHPPLTWSATAPAADPDGDGIYDVAVPLTVAGDSVAVAYKVKVDGVGNPDDGWQRGRNHGVTVVRGEGAWVALAWEDEAPAPPPSFTGRVDRIEGVAGAGLGPRDVFVYVPPGYDAGDRRYPVLYLHDGQHVFDASASGQEWRMDEAAEALIAAGEVEPLLIVGVANTPARTDEYTPTARPWRYALDRTAPPTSDGPLGGLTGTYAVDDNVLAITADGDRLVARLPGETATLPLVAQANRRYLHPTAGVTFAFERGEGGVADRVVATKPTEGGQADAYGTLLVETVKPLVDSLYRTRPDAASTGLGGASFGGLVTVYLGLERPDVFGRLIAASPSVWWDDRWILGAVARAAPPAGQRVWVDAGTGEGGDMVPGARALRDALLAAGWDPALVHYVEVEGAGHSERAWAARAPDMLRFLFPAE